jgi:hypothetical protein
LPLNEHCRLILSIIRYHDCFHFIAFHYRLTGLLAYADPSAMHLQA